jgi:UPF0755 protein
LQIDHALELMMSNRNADEPGQRQLIQPPKSPAEALEPARPSAKGKRPRRKARRLSRGWRIVNTFLTLTVFGLMTVGGGALWVRHEVNKPGPAREAKVESVRKGEGAREVAARLEADGVISSQQLFIANHVGHWALGWLGMKPLQIKAGEFDIPAGASLKQVADILNEGRSTMYRVTVPEGLTTQAIINRLRADPNLTGDITIMPGEGTLLPDTYKFSKGMTRQQLVDLMQAEQKKLTEKLWLARQDGLPFQTVEDAVTFASIVEKETGSKDERDRVAAVFVNRLRKKMRLQSDPTILYGLFLGATEWGRPIYRSEIQSKTAHNTYQIEALPPTPICNPGKSAIEAALNPAKTGDLYFVANGQGGHIFTATLADHNNAVANWRKAEKEIRAKQAEQPVRASRVGGAVQAAPVAAVPEADEIVTPGTIQQAAAPAAAAPTAAAPAAAEPPVPLPQRKPKK